jgi:hypothetical protein
MATKTKPKTIEFNPVHEAHGYRHVRWIENASRGLRLVGFADEIARAEHSRAIDHTGWYTDDDGDFDKYRGVVYQLPARNGATQYVYGFADPNNDDCALLCFDPETDKMEAARYADNFAERFAEQERDYQRAWRAGRDCEELEDQIKSMRKDALAIGEEMRAAKRASIVAPTICATVRGKIMSLYRSIQKARKERAELFSMYGKQQGFAG